MGFTNSSLNRALSRALRRPGPSRTKPMAPSPGVAFMLEGAGLAFATIQLPLAPLLPEAEAEGQQEPDLLPARLPARFAALSRAVAAVRELSSMALPFAAHALGPDEMRVVMLKQHVAGVFKLLREKQGSCGIVVKDVKRHVSLAPLPAPELEQACTCGLLASLLPRGWWQLDEDRVLGANVLEPSPDGSAQACGSLTLRVHAEPADKPDKLFLLVKPEQVEFRHPACRPDASLGQRHASLAGAECFLLPDLRPALIHRLHSADAATLARLRPLWASYGMPLPPDVDFLVEVSLDSDPDAPTFPYPPCRVLGSSGLLSVASKRTAPAVQAVLAKLRDDLVATPIKFLGASLKVAAQAHEWYSDGTPPPLCSCNQEIAVATAQPLVIFTARQLAEQAKAEAGSSGRQLALGEAFDVASFGAAGAGVGAQQQRQLQQQRQKRQHFVTDPKLQAAFEQAKRELTEAEKPATAARPGALVPPAAAVPTKATSASHVHTQAAAGLQPFALRQAATVAAAAGGSQKPPAPTVPVFKRVGATPTAAGRGKKRPAAAKPAMIAKRLKGAVPASTAGTAGADSSPPRPAVSLLPGLPASSAAAEDSAPLSAFKPAVGKGKAAQRASTTVEGGGTGAALPPKAPAKPRAKAANIDVAAVTAKVQQAHTVGMLGKLTIAELKAFLRSVWQPVGGKKGELEERVRGHLRGGPPLAGVAAAAGSGP